MKVMMSHSVRITYLIVLFNYVALQSTSKSRPDLNYIFVKESTCAKPVVSTNVKTILTWNDFFGAEHFGTFDGKVSFKDCVFSNCELWHRLDLDLTLPYDEYDAVLFHGINTDHSSPDDLPAYRSPYQRYLFVLHESPAMQPDIYNFTNYFNWTVSYRRDSDVFNPMTYLREIDVQHPTHRYNREQVWRKPTFRNLTQHIPEFVAKKTKLVTWFVSNSISQSKREVYVEELSKYLQVDIYGSGRNLTCDRTDTNCDQMLDTTYKFYLAFENSLCYQYVSEKLARGFRHYVIPVVYGDADYTEVAPPLSYINAKEFGSPKDLAKYLLFLDRNPREYEKYFWWKRFYREERADIWCDICAKLNSPYQQNRVYQDMELWWKIPDVCTHPEDFFTRNFYRSIYMMYPDTEQWWIDKTICPIQ